MQVNGALQRHFLPDFYCKDCAILFNKGIPWTYTFFPGRPPSIAAAQVYHFATNLTPFGLI
jgi:hypothetical protein